MLQLASREQAKGNTKYAEELRKLAKTGIADLKNSQPFKVTPLPSRSAKNPRPENLDQLLSLDSSRVKFSQLVLDNQSKEELNIIIHEYRQKAALEKFGLNPRRKILLTGPPGTGKTLTASVLSTELKLPLYTIQIDGLISRYLGETAAKLRAVFEEIHRTRAIYFFDEFDAIGAQRSASNDVGEIRRVLNSFLQFFETDNSQSLIVCATNHPEMLDSALFRRFDCVIRYEKPGSKEIVEFINSKLFRFDLRIDEKQLVEWMHGLSYAEIGKICDDAAKRSVLAESAFITEKEFEHALRSHLHS